ncbi:hypothetical protein TREES_T100000369 [Tupaia chinensis]|uniref:Uncharacterized protein n=1 Tax=Tupaia chinensis TaxID=246437 RepID=L9KWQ7_TUPCH|nr:hypothetical protein TREES_T100000369 [Tupaia chinensis]
MAYLTQQASPGWCTDLPGEFVPDDYTMLPYKPRWCSGSDIAAVSASQDSIFAHLMKKNACFQFRYVSPPVSTRNMQIGKAADYVQTRVIPPHLSHSTGSPMKRQNYGYQHVTSAVVMGASRQYGLGQEAVLMANT